MIRAAMLALLVAIQPAGAESFVDDGDFQIVLDEAIHWRNRGALEKHAITIDVAWRNGAREKKAWAFAETYNERDHTVVIDSWSHTDDTITAEVTAQIGKDPYAIPGGLAMWTIKLKQADGTWTGTYAGRTIGTAVQGTAKGVWKNSVFPAPISGHVPIEPGEHPRLLIRKQQLPALIATAQTPEGRKIVESLRRTLNRNDALNQEGKGGYITGVLAAGYALLWLVDGQQAEFDRATALCIEAQGATTAKGEVGGYQRYYLGVALCYDLLYNDWDEETRLGVAMWLSRISKMFAEMAVPIRQADVPLIKGRTVHSNSFMAFRASAALAALACYKDPSPYPRPPDKIDVTEISGFVDWKPSPGLPVTPIKAGYGQRTICSNLLMLGPLPGKPDETFVTNIDKNGTLNIEETVVVAGEDRSFEAIPQEMFSDLGQGRTFLDARKVVPPDKHVFLYGAIEILSPGVFHVGNPHGAVEMWLAGIKVGRAGIVRLQTGLYPLIAKCRGIHPPIGKLRLEPQIRALEDPALQQQAWQTERERWLAAGKTQLRVERDLAIFARHTQRYFESSMGATGIIHSQAGTGGITNQLPLYILAEQHVRGLDLTAGNGYGKSAITALLRGEGNVWRKRDRGANSVYFRALYYLTEETLRPYVAWALDRFGSWPTRPLNTEATSWPTMHMESTALLSLRMLSEELASAEPDPLPKIVHDEKLGSTIFTSGIEPGKDVSLYVTRDAIPMRPYVPPRKQPRTPYHFSGNFELYGLGAWFAKRDEHRQHSQPIYFERWMKNVPNIRIRAAPDRELPEQIQAAIGRRFEHIEQINALEVVPADPGKKAYRQFDEKTGSGSITWSYDTWRSGIFGVHGVATYDTDQIPEMSWKRSIAVDFSVTGAAAVVAVVDDFTGPDVAETGISWIMRWGDVRPTVQPATNDFELQAFGRGSRKWKQKRSAKLWGKVLAPAEVSFGPDELFGTPIDDALMLSGGHQYFVVMVIGQHEGTPPQITVEGEGLQAVVTVNDKRIAYIDEHLEIR